MPKLIFRLNAVSPWFLYGADPRGQPELRAASVRGQLRYWLRAIFGAQSQDLSRIWDAESAVFGSTGQGSAVAVRLFGKNPVPEQEFMLPHRSERRSPQAAIPAGYGATLEIVTRPGVNLPPNGLSALQVWSLLGGIGKRSRRMFGSVDVRLNNGNIDWYAPPVSPQALAETIHSVLGSVIRVGSLSGIPPFPTLHPQHSWVIVGGRTYTDPMQANIDLFRDLLRISAFRSKEQTFGQAMGGRRSSPLIAQLRRVGDEVVPVLTAIRSKPDRNIDWDHLKTFMKAAESYFEGTTVWGGWS